MLAYGRSKRTLRFSCGTSHLPLGLAASEELLSTPPDLPAGEDFGSTPDHLLRSSAPSRRSPTDVARHSPSSPCYSAGTVRLSTHVRNGGRGHEDNRGGSESMNSGGGGGGGIYGHQQRPGDPAPARKRFRLDMDLGSDSDSSGERDDDGPTQQSLSAGRGEFTNNYLQVARGKDGSDIEFGSSGSGLRQQGSVGRDVLGQKGPHEAPTHKTTAQERWQVEGGTRERTWNRPGSVGYSGGGGGGGRAGQYLDDDRRESLPFATPDHAGELTVRVALGLPG